MTSFLRDGRSRAVAVWLFVVAALVFGMVVLGGATRLTGSGLSITEWKPVTGAVPPMSGAGWAREFALYKATAQYKFLHEGMSLAQFQFIYWWEWSHRLLGRLVGALFAIGLVAFLALRKLPRRLIWRCAVLLVLGGLQGLVGWWMVQSGLDHRVAVAPERLMAHLGLALVLLSALVWTALEAWFGQTRGGGDRRDGWSLWSAVLAVGVFAQCLLGALVAGNQAGLVFNDWPMMNGRVFPEGYVAGPFWATMAHSQAAVQFNHRIVAYGVWLLALLLGLAAFPSRGATVPMRMLAVGVALAATGQAALGVATLMLSVPLPLAMLHQAGAAVLLILSVALAWRSRRL